MEITVGGGDVLRESLDAFPKQATRAMVRAMNRAITSGQTVMVKMMAADVGLRSGDIKKALTLTKATAQRPAASLASGLKRLPLIAFNAKGPEPSRGKGRGVSYRMKGGRGLIPNAFISRMKSGHRGVFVRSGKTRLPVRELFGPSLGHVFAKYRPEGIARMRESFATNLAHELGFKGSRATGAD